MIGYLQSFHCLSLIFLAASSFVGAADLGDSISVKRLDSGEFLGEYQLGLVKQDSKQTRSISFANPFDEQVEIDSVTRSCGCVDVTVESSSVLAGELIKIELEFLPRSSGKFVQSIVLAGHTAMESFVIRVDLVGKCRSYIEVETSKSNWVIDPKDVATKKLELQVLNYFEVLSEVQVVENPFGGPCKVERLETNDTESADGITTKWRVVFTLSSEALNDIQRTSTTSYLTAVISQTRPSGETLVAMPRFDVSFNHPIRVRPDVIDLTQKYVATKTLVLFLSNEFETHSATDIEAAFAIYRMNGESQGERLPYKLDRSSNKVLLVVVDFGEWRRLVGDSKCVRLSFERLGIYRDIEVKNVFVE